MTIIEKAKLIATVAHGATGQRRKHSGIAYINHPADVVNVLTNEACSCTRRMIAAAWLHDVVEDTHLTIDFIRDEFDTAIARMVYGLTNQRPEGMNRAERHAHNTARLALASDDVKTIKLADCIANMRDVVREDPNFAPVYLAEKRVLLDQALVGGDPQLWAIASRIIVNYFASVKPVEMIISCPECGEPHVDEGVWATTPHKTHQCQACSAEWRPYDYATVGVPAKTA